MYTIDRTQRLNSLPSMEKMTENGRWWPNVLLPKSSAMYTAEKSKHGLVNLAARVIIMVIKADSSAGGVNSEGTILI